MTRAPGLGAAVDLSEVGPAFSDTALGSQAVFRAALEALARPGHVQVVPSDAHHPTGTSPAAAALLLALLDADCTLWLAPRLATGPAGAWLRFHTGCRLVSQPDQAGFAWADADQLPLLERFSRGGEFDPQISTTCLIQVDALDENTGWSLRGPGVCGVRRLAVTGLGAEFLGQWRVNHGLFPRGVDVLLCAGQRVAGLSRTTVIEG